MNWIETLLLKIDCIKKILSFDYGEIERLNICIELAPYLNDMVDDMFIQKYPTLKFFLDVWGDTLLHNLDHVQIKHLWSLILEECGTLTPLELYNIETPKGITVKNYVEACRNRVLMRGRASK